MYTSAFGLVQLLTRSWKKSFPHPIDFSFMLVILMLSLENANSCGVFLFSDFFFDIQLPQANINIENGFLFLGYQITKLS